MIRKLYTITRDVILGLTELPALHSLAREATDRRIDELAKKCAVEYCHTEYDQDIANLTEERDELMVKLSNVLGELGWHKPELPKQGEIKREIDKLFGELAVEKHVGELAVEKHVGELAVEKHVGELQWGWARERISGQVQHIKDVDTALSRSSKENFRLECERERAIEERDELKAKLARHIEAERWRQVTNGEGESLPEGVEVIGRFSEHSGMFIVKSRPDRDGIKTFEWRFASSEDVPNG
jgi:hypothetical protein